MKNIFIIWMPEMYLALAIVFLLGYGVIYSKLEGQLSQQRKITWLSILTLMFTIFMTYEIKDINITQGLIGTDNAINMVKLIIMLSSIVILLMSLDYYKSRDLNVVKFEYPILILLTTLGILLLISSKDLITLYLSIEIMSLSSYILATIKRDSQFSTEAGIKYFILGAVSSGIILFGCAILYTLTGETSFQGLSAYIWYAQNDDIIGLAVGATFIITALLFKLAAAPFHMWAPDVYEGSPTIVTGLFAIVPKLAIFGTLIGLLFGPFANLLSQLQPLIFISAILSVLVGSFGAINQTKIKRLVAYSAIGHTGFILLGIATGSLESLQAAYIYIIVYIIMSCNMFALILSVFGAGVSNYITQLSGLSRSNPILAISFALSLLSIAGIPPLAGFFSKYFIFVSLIEAQFISFALIAIIASVIASFYYIRIIKWIYFKDSLDFHLKDLGSLSPHQTIGSIKSLILGSTLYFILTFMFYPNPLISFINQAAISALI